MKLPFLKDCGLATAAQKCKQVEDKLGRRIAAGISAQIEDAT